MTSITNRILPLSSYTCNCVLVLEALLKKFYMHVIVCTGVVCTDFWASSISTRVSSSGIAIFHVLQFQTGIPYVSKSHINYLYIAIFWLLIRLLTPSGLLALIIFCMAGQFKVMVKNVIPRYLSCCCQSMHNVHIFAI